MTTPPLPEAIATAVARALGADADPRALRSLRPVGGGCIHPAFRVETNSGAVAFLKWSPRPGFGGFGVEARQLRAMRERGGVRVPEVLGCGDGREGAPGWLLLELVVPGTNEWDPYALGRGLAEFHRPLDNAAPGWEEDGWIGSLRQHNRWDRAHAGAGPRPAAGWPDFWFEARLLPLWERVAEGFPMQVHRDFDRLGRRIDEVLAGWEDDGLSLLHGDLWSGNVIAGPGGAPYLVDPALYRGHREVDLAMMELFGGFPPEALRAYGAAFPATRGDPEVRRAA